MSTSTSQMIDTDGKVVLILDRSDFDAINSLLYDIADQPEKIRKIAQENQLCLGANHIESLHRLWSKLHGMPSRLKSPEEL